MATKTKSKKPASKPTKRAKERKTRRVRSAPDHTPNGESRPSLINAAVRVLSEESRPMSSRELVEAAETKGYWTSPAGKTPHQTLSAGIQREIKTKGIASRFVKVERGKFALREASAESTTVSE